MRFFYMGSIAGILLVAACLVNVPDPDAGFRCLSHDDCIDGEYFCDVRHWDTDENGKQRGHCFAWVEHGCNGDCAGECIQDTLEETERCVESPQESGSDCATSSDPDGCCNPGDAGDPNCSQGGTLGRGAECSMTVKCSGEMECVNSAESATGGICTPTCGDLAQGNNCNYDGQETGFCVEVSEQNTDAIQNVCVKCPSGDCTVCELKDETTVANTYEDALECQSFGGDCNTEGGEECGPTEDCVENQGNLGEYWCVLKNGEDCQTGSDCASGYCNAADDRCWNDSGCSNSVSCAGQDEACVYGVCVPLANCNADDSCVDVFGDYCVQTANAVDVCVEKGALTEANGSCAETFFGEPCQATWGSEGHYGLCASAPLAQNGGNTVACAPCPKCSDVEVDVCGISTALDDMSSYKTVTCCTTGTSVDGCCNPEYMSTDPDCNQSGGGGGSGDVHDAVLDSCNNNQSNFCDAADAACMATAGATFEDGGCSAGCYCVPQFGADDTGSPCDVGGVKGIVRMVKTWDYASSYVCAPCPPSCDEGDNCICGPTDCGAGGISLDESTQCQ